MINYIYARRDCASERFDPLIIAASDEAAFRTLIYTWRIPDILARKTYKYFRLGMFNNETGGLEATDPADISEAFLEYCDQVQEAEMKRAAKFEQLKKEIDNAGA